MLNDDYDASWCTYIWFYLNKECIFHLNLKNKKYLAHNIIHYSMMAVVCDIKQNCKMVIAQEKHVIW